MRRDTLISQEENENANYKTNLLEYIVADGGDSYACGTDGLKRRSRYFGELFGCLLEG